MKQPEINTPGDLLRYAMRVRRVSVTDIVRAGRIDRATVKSVLADEIPISASAAVAFWRATKILPSRGRF